MQPPSLVRGRQPASLTSTSKEAGLYVRNAKPVVGSVPVRSDSATIPADAHRLSGVAGGAVAAAKLADRSTDFGPIGFDRCAWLSPNVGRVLPRLNDQRPARP